MASSDSRPMVKPLPKLFGNLDADEINLLITKALGTHASKHHFFVNGKSLVVTCVHSENGGTSNSVHIYEVATTNENEIAALLSNSTQWKMSAQIPDKHYARGCIYVHKKDCVFVNPYGLAFRVNLKSSKPKAKQLVEMSFSGAQPENLLFDGKNYTVSFLQRQGEKQHQHSRTISAK